jgi:prepilin-type N-terminal cleavage/methylation domain-containing protein
MPHQGAADAPLVTHPRGVTMTHPNALRRSLGFTLVELLIVGAVLAILAAIAIPTYRGYVRRSKSATASKCLSKLYAGQERYRADRGTYATDIAALTSYQVETNCEIQGSATSERYTMNILTGATSTKFTGEARGMLSGSDTTDIWTINQDGKLEHTSDGT